MPDFALIPKDVLVKVLYDLDVPNILSFERTCKHARDTVPTRLLWLKKMDELDQFCAPDLPPNVDIDTLTACDLRGIVTKALRTYKSVSNYQTPVAEYVSIGTIIPSLPATFPPGQKYSFCDVKVTPGGRHLFMRLTSDNFNQLRLLDLANGNKCIWSFDLGDPQAYLGYERDALPYDFEAFLDGSMILAFMIKSNSQNSSENQVSSSARVLRLAPTGPGDAIQEQDIISLELNHRKAQEPLCAIKGRFSVFLVPGSKITVVDCQRVQVATFDCSSIKHGPQNPQIWRDHLFYTCRGDDDKTRICAVELIRAMGVASESPDVVELKHLDTYIFKPTYAGGSYYSSGKLHDVRLSFCEGRKREDTVIVSMIGVTSGGYPELGAVRALFRPGQVKKWSQLDNSAWQSRVKGLSAIRLGSTMTCSGRLLVSPQKNGRIGYALAAINKRGELICSELSQNVYFHVVASLHREIYMDDMSNLLEDFMDPYSGALVLLKDRKTGKDAIELFYPK